MSLQRQNKSLQPQTKSRLHNLGFPRIGARRELKFAQEAFWKGEKSEAELLHTATELRVQNWKRQAGLDLIPVGDFSLYDQVLDLSFTLGNLPARVQGLQGSELDQYFRVARGRSANDSGCNCVHAGEMTKWFDTNYHYIVPEFSTETRFSLNPSRLLAQVEEAQAQGHNAKPVLIGPVTYLLLGKSKDETNPLSLLAQLLPVYAELLGLLAEKGIEWVQIDEPTLVTELAPQWQEAFRTAYAALTDSGVKLLLTTYFGPLKQKLELACSLPVDGLHLDAVNARDEVEPVIEQLSTDKVLSLGVVNGRNIWKTDLSALLDWLEPVAARLGSRLWIAPSCSLLHVPVDLASEQKLDAEIRSWLAFAQQKLDEIWVIHSALNNGRASVAAELAENLAALNSRRTSPRVHNPKVQNAVAAIDPGLGKRKSAYPQRAALQRQTLNLRCTRPRPSVPSRKRRRSARHGWRSGRVSWILETIQSACSRR